jgi:hypothetical protein
MNKWLQYEDDGSLIEFNGSPNSYGFVYIITNKETGKIYVGRKAFLHNKKKKLTKKELSEQTGPGRRSTTKIEQVDSGWEKYWGSSKDLLVDIKKLGEDKFERTILTLCSTKKQLTYYEVYFQIVYGVLHNENSYNNNILGRFFPKDLI